MISGVDILKGLEHYEKAKLPTYHSPEAKQRATELAETASNCVHYLEGFYENKVQNKLLVLNEKDWTKRLVYPYGLIAGIQNYLWYPTAKTENPVFKEMKPYYENASKRLQRARVLGYKPCLFKVYLHYSFDSKLRCYRSNILDSIIPNQIK